MAAAAAPGAGAGAATANRNAYSEVAIRAMTPIQRNQVLFDMSAAGMLDKVRLLVKVGANKETTDNEGRTPLYVAAMNGHTEIVKFLLEGGLFKKRSNPNAATRNGNTPLHAAAANGHTDIVKILIRNGAKRNAINVNHWLPIHYAAWNHHFHAVGYLMTTDGIHLASASESGLDSRDQQGRTPLFLAAEKGYTDILHRFVNLSPLRGSDRNNEGISLLMIAAANGHLAAFDYLLDLRRLMDLPPDVRGREIMIQLGGKIEERDAHSQTVLTHAVLNNRVEIVRRLIQEEIVGLHQPDVLSESLYIAAENGYTEIVDLLLRAEPDRYRRSHRSGLTPIEIARTKGHMDIVRLLYEPTWRGWSRRDIESFNLVLDTNPTADGGRPPSENWSLCPVCLAYSERSEGCMYMHHNCSSIAPYYHKELYDRFKSEDGYIEWCTICGRICKTVRTETRTVHRHYQLTRHYNERPRLLEPAVHAGGLYFGGDSECRQMGGGGYDEKLARMSRMREYALRELNASLDKTYKQAWNELVENTWDAPMFQDRSVIEGIKERKAWAIPNTNFPEPPAAEAAPVANESVASLEARQYYPFAGRPAALPIVHAEGGENVNIGVDYPILFQMRHRQANGEIKTHAKKSSLETILTALRKVAGADDFGTCIIDGEHTCSGIIYPGELQYMLDAAKANGLSDEEARPQQETIDIYKSRFTEHFGSPGSATFRDHVSANIAAAEGMAVGGAGQGGGGKRRTRRFRKNKRHATRHRR